MPACRKGLMSTDELRRAMESLPGHKDMSYYHRWAAGMIAVSIERGTFCLQVPHVSRYSQ